MRKMILVISLAALSILFIPKSAETSNVIETTLFPADVTVNNKQLTFSAASPVLNFGGKAYLPVRELFEQAGGIVSYDEKNRTIEINTPSHEHKKSEISSMSSQGDYSLYIHSGKKRYKYGELLDVWGTFLYSGEEDAVIGHGSPLLTFGIEDSQGNLGSDRNDLYLFEETITKNTVYTSAFSWDLIKGLNYIRSGIEDPALFEANFKNPWYLEKGQYTIHVKFGNSIDGKPLDLTSNLVIDVE
jgi:hypothetical protein